MIFDVVPDKLTIAATYPGIVPLTPAGGDLGDQVMQATQNWGADVVFECSGHPSAFPKIFHHARPGGYVAFVVFVGMPAEPAPSDVVTAQTKELWMETVFRYANVYDRAHRIHRKLKDRPQSPDHRDLPFRRVDPRLRACGRSPPRRYQAANPALTAGLA
ncbi:MAG: zinc-binding dehydrogenase [Paracoccaceae bacterium]